MKSWLIVTLGLLVLVLPGQGPAHARDPESVSLKAGAAERDISPPVGMEIMHYFRKNIGIHDPLFLRALVLEDAKGSSFALITADLICAGFRAVDELRDRVKAETGVTEVWFNCSHTHASRWLGATGLQGQPWTAELAWDEFLARPHSRDSPEAKWNRMVHRAAVDLVAEARKRIVPVSLHMGRSEVQVGFNRRVTNASGRTHMAVNRKGVAVPWVNVLLAKSLKTDQPVAVLFEHAAHPVTVPHTSKLVSADFPGAAVAHIREALGPDVIAMFAQGACGNINSFPLRSTHDDADAAGRKLGKAVLEAMKESVPIKATNLTIRNKRILLPTRPLPDPEVVAALRKKNINNPDRLKQLDKITALHKRGAGPPPRRFDVYGVMLGREWCLIGMTYEVFSQYELWVDRNAPFKRTMTLGLTNGGRAYIGTDAALAMGDKGGYEAGSLPNWGGHETMSPYFGPPAVGAEVRIQEALTTLWK